METDRIRIIVVDIDASINLVVEREYNPFVSVYLTGGLRPKGPRAIPGSARVASRAPQATFSDTYQTRLSAGSAITARHPRTPPKPGTAPERVHLTVRLPLSDPGGGGGSVARDECVCVQAFCEVECEDGEWGCHACGWGAVTLRSLTSGARSSEAPLFDQGPTGPGARGSLRITVADRDSAAVIDSLRFAEPSPDDLVSGESGFRDRPSSEIARLMGSYARAAATSPSSMAVTSADIVTTRLPMYATCGRCLCRPPCAFVMTLEPQGRSEDYFLRALDCSLARRLSGIVVPSKRLDALMGRAGSESLGDDERGAVLMETATLLGTSCAYFFDMTLARDGSDITPGEDFSRLANMTLALDCEDAAYDAMSCLWDVLVGDWRSEAMAELRKIRMQYVVTVALKAVTAPAASKARDPNDDEDGLCGHDSCDLVPVLAMKAMIDASGHRSASIDAIARERAGILLPRNGSMAVVVGEGTGRVVAYSEKRRLRDAVRRPSRIESHVLKLFRRIFPAAGSISPEDHIRDTDFYRFAVSALIHDTLLHARRTGSATWDTPQVTYATKAGASGRAPTLGASHSDYCGRRATTVAIPVVAPSAQTYRAMLVLEKFEHPEIAPRDPPTAGPRAEAYAGRCREIEAAVRRTSLAVSGRAKPEDGAAQIDVAVPLRRIDGRSLSALESALRGDPAVLGVGVGFERIIDGIETAIFSVISGAPRTSGR